MKNGRGTAAAGWPRAGAFAILLSCLCAMAVTFCVKAAAAQKAPPIPVPSTKPVTPAKKEPAAGKASPVSPTSTKDDQQLSQLALALRDKPSDAAELKLAAFAKQHEKDDYGQWAALALGHYNLDRSHTPEALKWFAAAMQRPTRLEEYAMFWHAQTLRQMGRNEEGVAELGAFRQKFPESVMTDVAVQSYAEGALALGKPQSAAGALDGYTKTSQKSVLLLLSAQAHEKVGNSTAAAKDYLTLYYGFPLSDEARAAGQRIPELARQLGESFPAATAKEMSSRAEALYGAHRWSEAIQEFEAMLPQTDGADHAHAELRIAQSHSAEGGSASSLAAVKFSDPEAEAERLFSLSQAYRNEKRENEMLDAITQCAERYPQSQWAAESLFAAGNYYWVLLDRQRAADYYRRTVQSSPSGKNASVAAWRATWAAYMDRKADSVSLLELFIRTYPTSNAVPDALYWLGRAAERGGSAAQARSFYLKDAERFPQTFFGLRAADRIKAIGTQPVTPVDIVSAIPDAPPIGAIDAPIPAEAQDRWQRAMALRMIGFDASAELELRAAYSVTPSPRLLLETAEAALAADHYSVGISLIRQAYPQPEAHRSEEMPASVARVLYPLPYFSSVTTAAARDHVDPMIVTGIMRQESAFQPDAISSAGAVGLMQVLPKTAPHLSQRLHLRYTRTRLFDPQYNVELGTLYLSDLISQFGGPEAALAAYNAGEDRSKLWTSERNFSEPAEFVESIPFTQTRDYVQIVMRNAEIYRQLNSLGMARASTPAPAKSTATKRHSSKSSAKVKTQAASR
jgi:peptidoglycan lytic transglycosylase